MCCKLASNADVNRGLSWPDSQTFEVVRGSFVSLTLPTAIKRGRLLLGLLASSCIIRGINPSLFIYFKTIQACNDCERFGIEGKK